MATKRIKSDVLEDRISELPDDVLLRILSLLPTVVAVRTSLVSQRWRRMWTLVPAVDIDSFRDIDYFTTNNKRGTGRKMFAKFVDGYLKYPFTNVTLSKFKLRIDHRGKYDRVDGWSWLSRLSNVNELELEVRTGAIRMLPRRILKSKELTRMSLNFVMLKAHSPAYLPSLKELCLENVTLDNLTLNTLLSGCPLLEKLEMASCFWGSDPRPLIKVEAANLQSFVFNGDHGRYRMGLGRFRTIRNISLSRVCFDDDEDDKWLEDCIPNFPLLESLKLTLCPRLRNLKIRNQNLKSFAFESHDNDLRTTEVTIDTPSLEYFSYTATSMIKISLNAPNILMTDIRILGRVTCDREWYVSLIRFLSEFDGCQTVHMLCSSKKVFIVPVELRKMLDPPFRDLKFLKVKTIRRVSNTTNLLRNSLLWIAPSLKKLAIE